MSRLLRATETHQTQAQNHYEPFETSKDQSIVDGDRHAADDLLDEVDDVGARAAEDFARDRPPIQRREKGPEAKLRQLSEIEHDGS